MLETDVALYAACQGKITRVVVEHRDRVTRFGFRTIERLFKGVRCVIEALDPPERDNTRTGGEG